MKQTPRNKAEWGKRFALAHPPGEGGKYPGPALSAPEAAIARFKVDYPHLMKRIPVTVKDLPKHVGGRAAMSSQPPSPISSREGWKWLNAKPTPYVELSSKTKNQKRALYILAHEMRHVADTLKHPTNIKAAIAHKKSKVLPYAFRPSEWRADMAGVKKVVNAYNLRGVKKAAFKAQVLYGRRAKWIAYQRGPRAAAVGAVGYLAAVEYKKFLNKKKAAAEVAA